ncbi:hypothetical protein RvY_01086 [Ramazzottius varieornatus]|uniref:Chitin-binding type-2 domain-containing protein n=1 Tax=Ramazzottius varieornatus TaxID=947166 RepID=A0A1D1UM86_RAMVA|nr:hypothetical protein RvY_01086 [Ramazzottius varieornatus]
MDSCKYLQSCLFVVVASTFATLFTLSSGGEVYYVTGADMISVTCGTGEGWYRNPFDCNKFYACVGTNVKDYYVYDYDCPEGLHYDLNKTMCNYSWEVYPPCDVPPIPTTTRRPLRYAAQYNAPIPPPSNSASADSGSDNPAV